MSKRNDALEALSRPVPAQTATVVELKAEASAEPKAPASPAKPAHKTVANSYARTMLYLPPKAKRKFKEIAFHSNRKEHDVYVEALRDFLEKNGHKGLL
jgi:hypothetical protein